MAITAQCPSCKKRYQVKDQLAGQTVRCMACQKPMVIPRAPAAQPVGVGAAAQTPARGKPANQGELAEFARYGLEGPIQRTPDLFGAPLPDHAPDPLANHVVTDPGFGSAEYVPPQKLELNLAYKRLSEDDDEAKKPMSTATLIVTIISVVLGLVVGVLLIDYVLKL